MKNLVKGPTSFFQNYTNDDTLKMFIFIKGQKCQTTQKPKQRNSTKKRHQKGAAPDNLVHYFNTLISSI